VLIAGWAPEFLARHPGVKLELNVTDRVVDIIREGYDLAVRMGALRDTELISRKLANLRWILVASPAYIERRGAAGERRGSEVAFLLALSELRPTLALCVCGW